MKKATIAVITLLACSSGAVFAAPGFPGHKGPFHPGLPCSVNFHGEFRHADADHSKTLSQAELGEAVKKLNSDVAAQKNLLKDFKTADADKNGFVTLDELAGVLPPPPLPPEADGHGKHEDHKKPHGHEKPGHHKPHGNAHRGPDHKPHHGPRHDHHGPHGFHPGFRPENPVVEVLFHFDEDRDMKLSQKEYDNFLTTARKCLECQEKIIAALPGADLNKDGVVTFMEYNAVITQEMLKNAPKWKDFREDAIAPEPDDDDGLKACFPEK